MEKVLLDTDIGTDVDDAVALAYLLAQPECELLGITTVTGEAGLRAALASVLCQAAGRDIPIYPGEEVPLKVPQRQLQAQQAAALPRWPHQEDFPRGQAVDFMRRTIRAHPGEVTLCAIGPLTNIARLFSQDPQIPALLKGLVMMGGIFTPQPEGEKKTEWNAAGDPHATEIAYQARARLHRSLGLDVTQGVMLDADEVRRQFTAPLLHPVGLCDYRQGTVAIDMDRWPGLTVFQPNGPDSPHQVAASVDRERYFEHFFGAFK
jgi:inosine-uridine nucleoside N-ribohydrolase